jgi:exopolysaccharide production protein ExoQ
MATGKPPSATNLCVRVMSSEYLTANQPRSLLSAVFTQVHAIPLACAFVFFGATFVNTLDIGLTSDPLQEHVGHSAQQATKLLFAGFATLLGVGGALLNKQVQHALFSIRGVMLLALAAIFLTTSLFAIPERALESRAAAIVLVSYLCFIPTVVVAIGVGGFLRVMLASLTVFMTVCWGLYFFVPSLGVFVEVFDASTSVDRMGGLGHPNGLGAYAALALILSMVMLRSDEYKPPFRYASACLVGIIVLSVGTLFLSFSRTAIISTVAASTFLMFDRIWTKRGILGVLMLLVVALTGVLAAEIVTDSSSLLDRILLKLTKTGDVSELTSATGRTDIWAETIRLIAIRPWTGWGLEAAPALLVDHSMATHNTILHATLSGGLFAGGLVLALLLWNLFFGLRSENLAVRAISALVLISCLVENAVLDTFPSATTTGWIFSLLALPLCQLPNSHTDRVNTI